MKKTFLSKNQKGQAILMVVLILGATMLGVTTIAGYISLQKIKTVTGITQSAEAIYAADYGVECYLYKLTKDPDIFCENIGPLANGATAQVATTTDGVYQVIKSVGKSGDISRAFGVFFEQ